MEYQSKEPEVQRARQDRAIPLILLLDWQLTGGKYWLQQNLEAQGFIVSTLGIPNYDMRNRLVKWRKLILWWQYLWLGYQGARLAKRNNAIVVAVNFIAGAFAAQFVSKGARKVIALNLIAYDKGAVHSALRFFIYHRGFSSRRMIATVNSEEVRDHYLKLFKIHPDQISVLHDSWSPNSEIVKPTIGQEDFVFSGGEAARDWVSLLAVASKLPEIKFKVVARRMNWSANYTVPSNVEVFFDLNEDQFYSMAKQSRMVVLLLKGKITAGLIVLKKSILLGKLVISSDTITTRAYYPEICRDLLVPEGDITTTSSVLARYHSSTELTLEKARVLQDFVKANHSPEAFSRKVSELVNLVAYS